VTGPREEPMDSGVPQSLPPKDARLKFNTMAHGFTVLHAHETSPGSPSRGTRGCVNSTTVIPAQTGIQRCIQVPSCDNEGVYLTPDWRPCATRCRVQRGFVVCLRAYIARAV